MRDPYQVLGVARAAPAEEIKKAYRELAKRLHPDLNPGDKDAEAKFKDVSAAYDLLGDAEKRRRFDAGEIDETGADKPERRYYRDFAGSDAAHAYTSSAGFGDFADTDDAFAELLRRSAKARANRRGEDLHYRLPIGFAEFDHRRHQAAASADGRDRGCHNSPGRGAGTSRPSQGQG